MSLYYQTSIVPCISRTTGTLLCPELLHWLIQSCPSLEVQPAGQSCNCSRCVSPCETTSLEFNLGSHQKKPKQKHRWAFFIDSRNGLSKVWENDEILTCWVREINCSVSDGSWAFLALFMWIFILHCTHKILKNITCVILRDQMFSFQYKNVLLRSGVWNGEFLGADQVSSYDCHGLLIFL